MGSVMVGAHRHRVLEHAVAVSGFVDGVYRDGPEDVRLS